VGRGQSYRTYEEKRPPGEAVPEETPLEPGAPQGAGGGVCPRGRGWTRLGWAWPWW